MSAPKHKRIWPHTEISDDREYIVIGEDKEEYGVTRVAFRGNFDDCDDYASRNESPDNYERYYVAEEVKD